MPSLKTTIWVTLALLLTAGVLARAGMTRHFVEQITRDETRQELRVWDWWSASTNEEYGAYFAEIERTFEAQNPDIDVVYQIVPFGNYVQKLSTAMVGDTPPDVFQSSVYWAEGFYQRGMLRPLNGLLAADTDAPSGESLAAEQFLPSAWRHNQVDSGADAGTVFGIPQIIDASCLLWNLDILQEEAAHDEELRAMFARRQDGSIDYDRLRFDALRDWDHFRRVVDKLTIRDADGEIKRAGFVLSAYGSGAGMFSPWLAANGGRVQDSAGTKALFASPQGVETLDFLARLYWVDRVTPPFRRQMTDSELFQERKVACVTAGTWSGKDITRNSLGWTHFGKTAFPPGPSGDGHGTVTWGNMLVITQRAENVDAAWRYLKFVCGLPGSLLRSKHLGYNGPRFDFYATQRWQQALAERPYLSTVKQICLVGDKLRHTEIIAVDHQANPVFESVLLHYPEIIAGEGPYPSIEAALQLAARNVDNVYARYNQQVARWMTERRLQGKL
ncbi:MAG: extracellular solute-binding protein [Gemmatimonadetes bacterium]|jgi:ABC-type glycerol-3-phosphate transport system substrate-binding protein|nr:extracellular solute-binding protein [Gemmatimonadota bacterium]